MSKSILDVVILVAQRLDAASIPSMITGSFAANMYAEPRLTNDVDIVISLPALRSRTLLGLFQDDFYITEDAVADAFAGLGILNILHNETVFKCDIILLKNDDFSRSAFERRQFHMLQGYRLAFISVEDLILQKLLWNSQMPSEQQVLDVRKLLRASKQTLDTTYCLMWAARLGIEKELRQLL